MGESAGLFGQAAGLGAMPGTAYAQYNALKSQGEMEKNILRENARQAELQAVDARKRGDVEAAAQHKATQELLARQRVAAVAQGVNPNFGSAADLQAQALSLGRIDESTIRNSAAREAFYLRNQASGYYTKSKVASKLSKMQARNSLWLAGAKFAGDAGSLGYNWSKQGS